MLKRLLVFLSLAPLAMAQPRPVTGIAHTPDVDLAYEVYGAPSSSTPAIILNGGPGFLHDYLLLSDVFTVGLTRHRQVVFYDQRGLGKSRLLNPSAAEDMNAQVSDLEAIRATLGFPSFDVIGHSWGGLLAMGYAARFPEHIHKFVVIDSAAPKLDETVSLFDQMYPDDRPREMEVNDKSVLSPEESGRSLRSFLRKDFYSQEKFDHYFSGVSDVALGKIVDRDMNKTVDKAIESVDVGHDLANFHFPALVMNGRFDINVAVITAWKIYQAIPGAKLSIFEKSGHFPFYEEADLFLQALNDFLADSQK